MERKFCIDWLNLYGKSIEKGILQVICCMLLFFTGKRKVDSRKILLLTKIHKNRYTKIERMFVHKNTIYGIKMQKNISNAVLCA